MGLKKTISLGQLAKKNEESKQQRAEEKAAAKPQK
jgi:hypothetical protein